ncbi:hypothetical protein [Lutimonas vermicola]|uniref:Uncharacterized protein n=1 Tax=Lutimonas vermicola TaxID=414288 RepID=A0ABU9L2P2_9FLAO
MFNMFRSNDSIRKNYVESQNLFYNQSGYKATASTYDKVFIVTWDLYFTAKQSGLNYEELKADLKTSQSVFPDSQEDWALRKILIDNQFDTYELCYKCIDGEVIRAHKTSLL